MSTSKSSIAQSIGRGSNGGGHDAETADLRVMSTEGFCNEHVHDEGVIVHWVPPALLPRLIESVHPACACFLPSDEDVNKMIASIRRDGIQHPITRLNGQLLDGQTRTRAAIDLQRSVPCIDLAPAALGDKSPFEWVLHANLSANCGRRLTETQIALAAVKFDPISFENLRQEALNRMKAGVAVPDGKGTTVEQFAKRLGIAGNRLKNALAVVQADDPRLYSFAYSNILPISVVARITKLVGVERNEALRRELQQRDSKGKSHGNRNDLEPKIILSAELKVLNRCHEKLISLVNSMPQLAEAVDALAETRRLISEAHQFVHNTPQIENSSVPLSGLQSHHFHLNKGISYVSP